MVRPRAKSRTFKAGFRKMLDCSVTSHEAQGRSATGNGILDALPAAELERLLPHLEPASFALNEVLHRPGDEIAFVYFPVSAVLSVVTLLGDGSSIEVGMAGSEGMVGLAALFGDGISRHEVTVQGAGAGFRVSARVLREAVAQADALRDRILTLSQFVLAEISQMAACNGRHDLRSRYARWLLEMQDKLVANRFPVSQELVARLLGVQRTAVNATALKLRSDGLIFYRRGRIEILDRAGLEAAACECHAVMKDLRERFLRG